MIFHGNAIYRRCITLSVAMVCLLQLATKCQQIIHKPHVPYVTRLFMHVVRADIQAHSISYHENPKYTFYSPYDHDCCQKALLRAIFLATLWNSQDNNISTQKCKIVFALFTPGADVKIRTIGETLFFMF